MEEGGTSDNVGGGPAVNARPQPPRRAEVRVSIVVDRLTLSKGFFVGTGETFDELGRRPKAGSRRRS
jgi:hypothetical protein